MRSVVRFGMNALEAVPRAVDVEARGVADVLRLMLVVPTVPRRFMLVMRDALVVLAAMPGSDDPAPWHTFRARFVRVHGQTVHTHWASLRTGLGKWSRAEASTEERDDDPPRGTVLPPKRH